MRRTGLIVAGIVQGVGPRTTIWHMGQGHGLKGEAENLKDDAVRVVCEDEADVIGKFVAEVRAAKRQAHVRDIRVSHADPTGECEGFRMVLGDPAYELLKGFSAWQAYFEQIDEKLGRGLADAKKILERNRSVPKT